MNYTSIEQSKKLLELGLNPKTADMSYQKTMGDDDMFWDTMLGPHPSIQMNTFSFRNGYVLPCWSVGCLLNILKNRKDHTCLTLLTNKANKWNIHTVFYDSFWKEHEENNAELIDACYNMAIWLLENNYIKTK